MQVLRRSAAAGEVDANRCRAALAEALDVPSLTRDRRLARAPGVQARVEVV